MFPKFNSPSRKPPLEKITSIKKKGSVSDEDEMQDEFEVEELEDLRDQDIIELLKAKVEIDQKQEKFDKDIKDIT